MHEKPKVSFVCSVRDGEAYLERCAGGVLRQSVNEIELVLVDDHSKDSTWSLMEKLAGSDKRVKALKNTTREGLTYSLNIGLDFARGAHIARIDVDDFAHSNRIDTQLSTLENNPDAVMVVSPYRVVDEEDFELYCHYPSSDPKMIRWSLCFRNNIRHSTVMWKRSLDIRYDPSFTYAQDYDMWSRVSCMGDIVSTLDVLTTIKERRSSITSTKHNEQEAAADKIAAKMFMRYTDRTISERESRHVRMLHHLKNAEQVRVFEGMSEAELNSAARNYIALAAGFAKKESPEMEAFLTEIKHDLTNCAQNHASGSKASASFLKALSEEGASKWIADEINKVIKF